MVQCVRSNTEQTLGHGGLGQTITVKTNWGNREVSEQYKGVVGGKGGHVGQKSWGKKEAVAEINFRQPGHMNQEHFVFDGSFQTGTGSFLFYISQFHVNNLGTMSKND